MKIDIMSEIVKMVEEKNKEKSKDEKADQIKMSDFQKGKIRDLERSLDSLEQDFYKYQRELKSTDNSLASLDIDFSGIKKEIEKEIELIFK
jgi:hypothetical protein